MGNFEMTFLPGRREAEPGRSKKMSTLLHTVQRGLRLPPEYPLSLCLFVMKPKPGGG